MVDGVYLADLHTHTVYSDGDLYPKELIDRAKSIGVRVVSITDHDTTAAYTPDLLSYAKDLGVKVIPGIELSTVDRKTEEVIHVLGLNIQLNHSRLVELCGGMTAARLDYLNGVTKALADFGFQVRLDLLAQSGSTVTKAHIASDVLENEANLAAIRSYYIETMPTKGKFIEDWMIKGAPAYVEKQKTYTDEAIGVIAAAGGVSFWAHPAFNHMKGLDWPSMAEIVNRNKFNGIEAINIQYNKSNGDSRYDIVAELIKFAEEQSLRVSGGSDYHGDKHSKWGNHVSLGLVGSGYSFEVASANSAIQ